MFNAIGCHAVLGRVATTVQSHLVAAYTTPLLVQLFHLLASCIQPLLVQLFHRLAGM